MTTILRVLRLLLVISALLAAVWFGLKEGPEGLADAGTVGQKIAASLQILYGITALGCLLALFARPSSARGAFALWTVALTGAAGVASVAWGGTGWGTGALAGLAAAAIAALVSWGGIAHLRETRQSATSVPPSS